MSEPVNDPWLEDSITSLDDRTGPEHFAAQLADIANQDPEQFPAPADPAAVVEPVQEPVSQYAAPETFEVEGGGKVTYEEDEQGWHATLEYRAGDPIEVFHARTPLELSKQLAVGKLNASKKINQQNKQLQLVRKVDNSQPANKSTAEPTADQLFEIKTLFQSDPVAAFNKMLEITTGVNFKQFTEWAKDGRDAKAKQTTDQIAAAFFARKPAYLKSQNNTDAMTKYLTDNQKEFSVENLIEAYTELTEAGLLEVLPKPVTKPQVAATTAQPANSTVPPTTPAGIQRPVGRQNAVLGLRPGETTVVRPPAAERAPSVEDLENLPDDQIDQLFAGVRTARAQSSRR